MYQIGDRIFYPMHGAGVVEAIEEKEILGEKQLYYVMNIPLKNMQVMIPKNSTSNQRIRKVVDSNVIEDVFMVFHDGETDNSINHLQRHRINLNKIKSGDIYEGAEVIRDLIRISKKRSLGTEDRNILITAQQILISELILVKGIEEEEAIGLLNEVINN